MNDYNNGEIWGWNGGECPVHPDSLVRVWLRDGMVGPPGAGWTWSWMWANQNPDADIIAFQVTKPYVEPKVIWVNEYIEGDVGHSFPTEEGAKQQTFSGVIRTAVKYVEAKE